MRDRKAMQINSVPDGLNNELREVLETLAGREITAEEINIEVRKRAQTISDSLHSGSAMMQAMSVHAFISGTLKTLATLLDEAQYAEVDGLLKTHVLYERPNMRMFMY